MPSEEFMTRVLTTGRADDIDDSVDPEVEETEQPEALDLTGVEEAAEVEDQGDPGDEQPEEPSLEGEEDQDDEDVEAEEQPEEEEEAEDAAQQEEEFYLGRYRTREEAERGWLEKEQMISRQGDELAQMRQQMAEFQGYIQAVQSQPSQPGEFEEWAAAQFESGNAWNGANEVLDAALQTGDPNYVDAYVEVWKEVDPFEAARFRTMVDNQIALAQAAVQQESQPPPLQDVINESWLAVGESDPDFRNPEYAAGVGKLLKNVPALRAAAMSGDPELTRSAIAIARDGYRMQNAGTASGTPRKVKSSDRERLQQDKLDATVTTGDSSPDRGNGSTPEVPPELQDMMQRISAGEGGFPKLRE